MRRLLYAGIVIAIIAGTTVYVHDRTDRVTTELIAKLEEAKAYNNAGQYAKAIRAVEEFEEAYFENEPFFILFIRRDLVCNVHTTSASLKEYAAEENFRDFNADCEKTIEHIEVIRFSIMRLS